jgi:hypothetical protein
MFVMPCLLGLMHKVQPSSTLTHQSDNVDQPLLATQKEKKDYERKRKVAL